ADGKRQATSYERQWLRDAAGPQLYGATTFVCRYGDMARPFSPDDCPVAMEVLVLLATRRAAPMEQAVGIPLRFRGPLGSQIGDQPARRRIRAHIFPVLL